MALSIEKIRAKLKEQEEAKKNRGKQFASGDSAIYPFYNMETGDTAEIRFLPDKDENNDSFWKERLMIKLKFERVIGNDKLKNVTVQVPCLEMYSKKCPIIEEIRPWWKDDETMVKLARQYYKKPSYIMQGFVTVNPLEKENLPENPIRRFTFNKDLLQKVQAGMIDPDMEHMPTDYENGTDFKIIKNQKGEYADYSSSTFRKKSRALSQEELEAIEKFGLYNLVDFIPKEPSDEHVQAIIEMFHASVAGEPYDPDRWGKFYKPYGLETKNDKEDDDSESTPAPTPTKVAEKEKVVEPTKVETPVVVEQKAPEKTAASSKTQELLAKLRNKTK